jgi:hypothetical protein
MIPRKSGNASNAKLSIVNLLPSEKTYNVAKITSKQRTFGAGVTVEAVNLGVAGGKSRDRLYIAKDTDTVALQYPTDKKDGILSPWPSWLLPWLNNRLMGKNGSRDTDNCTVILPPQVLTPEGDLRRDEYDFGSAVMFGWQFRPVLGADYVASNVRTAFAQLALPTDMDAEVAPDLDVYVQTRWRAYSPSRQITGPSYQPTCQWKQLDNGITIYNPIRVKNVEVADGGGGILRIRAEGDLLSSSLNVRSGSTLIPPQFFDGKRLELFANAVDILHNGDLELLNEDGTETPLLVRSQDQKECQLRDAMVVAIPRPDGTSLVKATISRGGDYDPSPVDEGGDGPADYKILIGSDVYGLQDTPFLDQPNCATNADNGEVDCPYSFTAQTSALKAAQTFLVRDIAWDPSGKRGTIQFAPSFTSIASISSIDSTATDGSAGKCGETKNGRTNPPCWYEVKGSSFNRISLFHPNGCTPLPCYSGTLSVFKDSELASFEPLPVVVANTQNKTATTTLLVIDDTNVRIADSSSDKLTTLHFIWHQDPQVAPVEWPLTLKKASAATITSDPPFLHVADSRAVKFSGQDFTGFQSATFDGTVPVLKAASSETNPDKNGDKNSLTLQIPSAVTAKSGYKEIIAVITTPAAKANGAQDPKSPKSSTKIIRLPILVVAK